ncbi:response regulator transcription factor [Dyadobacter fermentans]|uniref:Two component transcriptional regulator, LuxR family n=1 Tax=Dyadobacter fermentans (strain ATCC 700827 / DSM 18053 / CIP 107007 / KCTC 52180 / NS114) TaxID=471854 RepID=C6W652_DYAFD|nr:response regulator transcription factor [Dyadobacter fermentans]ACT92532.1 two component transcriptional regulator, LuxR family [Dyadobacter fermentans DSM 18053]
MKFLCIENHPLLLLGLRMVFAECYPHATVAHAATFEEALTILETETFALAVVDIEIPGGENVRMMEIMREKQVGLPILIHSGFDEKVYALPYLQAGADGFISKQAPHEEFKNAVQAILDHGRYVSYEVQQVFLTSFTDTSGRSTGNPIVSLSPRERRVMQLMTEGKWTKEIAAIMNLKENTISTYKRRIYDKMQVKDPVELSKKIALFR